MNRTRSLNLTFLNPNPTLLMITAIAVGILNITRGDPGLMLVVSAIILAFLYSDRIDAFLKLPKRIKYSAIALIAVPGSFLFQQINSPAFALFFGGFKSFLNSTLGTFIPGSGAFFDIFVALLQFLFVLYMVLKGIKAFRERDNDEEFGTIMKVPVLSLIVLSVFDFVLQQVIAG